MIQNWGLVVAVFALLGAATGFGQWLRRKGSSQIDRRSVDSFNARIQAWWFFGVVLLLGFVLPGLTVLLFGLLSFWALREFVTLTPTRIGDHRPLFWVFFFFTPMQFVLVWFGNYDWFSVLIPVGGFSFVAARAALSGDYDRFLDRIAKILCGMMICVYFLSFAPALLYLKIKDVADDYAPARMLLFFVTMVLCSDLLQWAWSRVYGQHIVAEQVDATRSWEGVIGGAVCTAVLGTLLAWAAPFPRWWQTGAMSLLIALMAAAGALTMSAIKRDRGELGGAPFVEGPGGVLSRIDSICFAAPVFYHVSRYFFGA